MLPPFPTPPPPLGRRPRVSIVVNNHNYAEFLPRALESALRQRGEDPEVIVVDDGSTDSSREVIDRFAARIRPIFQENLGQKGAFNAGFAAATGDIVIFLDADDELGPQAASAVAAAFSAHPEAGRAVFRLEAVDSFGRRLGASVPPANQRLPDGDVRQAALSFPDDLAWPPTSGNAFATWALARIMPLPVDDNPVGGDYLLHALTPLVAPVTALDRVLGTYRVHDSNAHWRQSSTAERSQYLLRITARSHAAADRLAQELGYGPASPRSVTIAAHRLVSLRLGGPAHPIAHDNRRRALRAGFQAALGRSDVAIARRLLYLGWFFTVATAPRPLVRALAWQGFRRGHISG
jgi:Glycosyl transferase family 2